MSKTTSPILFWIGIALLAAYVIMEVVSGPPGPLRVAMVVVGCVALVLLVVDRLRQPRQS